MCVYVCVCFCVCVYVCVCVCLGWGGVEEGARENSGLNGRNLCGGARKCALISLSSPSHLAKAVQMADSNGRRQVRKGARRAWESSLGSRPDAAPRARASLTAAISTAHARLLQSLAT
jgi:hypothetical protein